MDHGLHREEPAAGSVSSERERACRRIDVLRREPARLVPARRRLRAQDFARHQVRRSAGGAGDEVRPCGQPENRQGARPRADADVHRPRRRGDRMSSRRKFITLLGGAVAAWPLAARAQQGERMRRIGVLVPATADDPVFQAWVGAFLQGLALLGWTIGRNLRIDTRWATTNAADIRRHAAELAALAPDAIQAVAPSLRVEVSPVNMRDANEIERAVAAFARATNGGLIVTSSGSARLHRDLIGTLAARHKLPAVSPDRSYVAAGGLISYGADYFDQYRRAAG